MDSQSQPLSDRLSITALAISLVALTIGFSSFLLAIFGTAEGYRKCARSVIGPWSSLRRREFKFSEFRLETKFVTPLIVIVTPYDLGKAVQADGADALYLLNPHPATDQDESALARRGLIWGRYDPARVLDESLHWADSDSQPTFTSHRHATEPQNRARSSQLVSDEGVESERLQGNKQRLKRRPGLVTPLGWTKASKNGPRNGLPVTWIPLLRDLHLLYLNYWPTEARSCKDRCQVEHDCSFIVSKTSEHRAKANETAQCNEADWQNDARTRVAIIPVEETWDFMPPDLSRPPASSTIGVILVLAMRLGMQWRSLDRARSQMNADGNGFNITSTEVRGMGIVLRFNASTHRDKIELVIPSRAVDKMMCGILPGDARLVQQDFDLVTRDRKVLSIYDKGGVLQKLGLSEDSIADIRAEDRWCTQNEVLTLLFTFLPLPGCHLTTFFFPAWKSRQYTIFHFFESRLALYNFLNRDDFPHTSTTKTIKAHFEDLIKRYAYEFFNGYHDPEPEDKNDIQRSIGLTEWCATQFEWTTEHFLKNRWADKNRSTRTWYSQLVAAHASLSARVMKDIPRTSDPQTEVLTEYQPMMNTAGITSTYFAKRLYELATVYAQNVSHEDYGIVTYMRQRALPKEPSEIVDAWWVLMFRGLVWDMSCKCLSFPGEPVPSSFYDDKTSVWFT